LENSIALFSVRLARSRSSAANHPEGDDRQFDFQAIVGSGLTEGPRDNRNSSMNAFAGASPSSVACSKAIVFTGKRHQCEAAIPWQHDKGKHSGKRAYSRPVITEGLRDHPPPNALIN
jgi:hypothetical protein